jgi:hypothetical protein
MVGRIGVVYLRRTLQVRAAQITVELHARDATPQCISA